MVSPDENGPFSAAERLSILQSLHQPLPSPTTPALTHVADINSKLTAASDQALKRRFMVFQWFNKLRYTGTKVSLPVFGFDQMVRAGHINAALPAKLQSNWRGSVTRLELFGFRTPSAIQCATIPLIAQERNLVAIAPTGSGKTLAYLLPLVRLLTRAPKRGLAKALIIAPTFELSVQIYKVCLQIIGKKSPFEGLRLGHLTKLLLEKKRQKQAVDAETLLSRLGRPE